MAGACSSSLAHLHRAPRRPRSAPTRPPVHLPRRARASLRMARPRRPQAHHRPRRAFARGSRSRLIRRPQHIRPLPLPPLDLGGAPAPRLRRRRPHLPALRRSTPPHRTAHRPSRPAQDPQQHSATRPRLHGPHRRAHANSSTSPEPAPLAPPSTLLARDPRRPTGPVVSTAPAPPPQRASNSSPARHRGPI